MDKAEHTMIDNLRKQTGKTLEEWTDIVRKSGLTKHGEVVAMLKNDHNFTHGFANLVAHKAKGSDAGSADNPQELIDKQYQGKESLFAVYETLISKIKDFGNDVEIAPKNNYVSLRRKKQFALIQPSTKTRLDIGLNIKGIEPSGRLELSGSFNAMCTHRIKTASVDDIDDDVITWLKAAYEQAK